VLRSKLGGGLLTSAVRHELVRADAELPLFDTRMMPERIAASLTDKRAAMLLCGIFGGLALLLAAVGIYGVLAYSVTQRTREIGIRTALGAGVSDILGMTLGQGLRLAATGLALGAILAFLAMRLVAAMLYDVKPADPLVFAAGTLVLGVVTALAAMIPSLRAVRIRPAVALRYE
jgi:ABC-type antimicrobial peptide transport system permease subunit